MVWPILAPFRVFACHCVVLLVSLLLCAWWIGFHAKDSTPCVVQAVFLLVDADHFARPTFKGRKPSGHSSNFLHANSRPATQRGRQAGLLPVLLALSVALAAQLGPCFLDC